MSDEFTQRRNSQFFEKYHDALCLLLMIGEHEPKLPIERAFEKIQETMGFTNDQMEDFIRGLFKSFETWPIEKLAAQLEREAEEARNYLNAVSGEEEDHERFVGLLEPYMKDHPNMIVDDALAAMRRVEGEHSAAVQFVERYLQNHQMLKVPKATA